MEIVKEITHRGAFGGGREKDDSDDLSDMNYAEKLVFSEPFLNALKELKVQSKNGNVVSGGSIILTALDFIEHDADDIGMNGYCHKVNQVFVAGRLPFYATSYNTDAAEKSVRTKTRGNHKGDSYKVTVSDRVRVYRISQEWDIDNYAVEGSANLKNTAYHTPTIGVIARTEKNMQEKRIVVGVDF